MIHHSISHGLISILSVVSAEFLIRQIRQAWPLMDDFIGNVSMWMAVNVPLGLSFHTWNQALVAMVLGLAWGGAFWIITIRPAIKDIQK